MMRVMVSLYESLWCLNELSLRKCSKKSRNSFGRKKLILSPLKQMNVCLINKYLFRTLPPPWRVWANCMMRDSKNVSRFLRQENATCNLSSSSSWNYGLLNKFCQLITFLTLFLKNTSSVFTKTQILLNKQKYTCFSF